MAVLKGIKCQFSGQFLLMAGSSDESQSEVRDAFKPRTIKGLCDQADISLEEILIFCQSCWKHLSHYDKLMHEVCELKLNWTHGTPYALCHSCLRLKNKVEFLCFYEETVSAIDVERESNCSIYQHHITCLKCSRSLTFFEVQACVFGLEAFQKVKGTLRGVCSMCRVF
uniref:Protein E6 n=1 Tax=Mops bat papillomavirus TaxID=3141892 RepID=A0AAU7E341_9PAPI